MPPKAKTKKSTSVRLSKADKRNIDETVSDVDAMFAGNENFYKRKMPSRVFMTLPRELLIPLMKFFSTLSGGAPLSSQTIAKMTDREMATYVSKVGKVTVLVSVVTAYLLAFILIFTQRSGDSVKQKTLDTLAAGTLSVVLGYAIMIIRVVLKRKFSKNDQQISDKKALNFLNRKVLESVKGRAPQTLPKNRFKKAFLGALTLGAVFGSSYFVIRYISCKMLGEKGYDCTCESVIRRINALKEKLESENDKNKIRKMKAELVFMNQVRKIIYCTPNRKRLETKEACAVLSGLISKLYERDNRITEWTPEQCKKATLEEILNLETYLRAEGGVTEEEFNEFSQQLTEEDQIRYRKSKAILKVLKTDK